MVVFLIGCLVGAASIGGIAIASYQIINHLKKTKK
jgi:hypothetical protein